jgi:molecular chaperone HtpG
MERIMKAQALRNQHMSAMMTSKKIMEINPDHTIIKNMKDKKSKNMVELLYDIASVGSGFTVNEPFQFSKRMYKVLETFSLDDTESDEVTEMESDEVTEMESDDDLEEVD